MNNYIVDTGDKVALRDALGHDVAWGDLEYGDATTADKCDFKEAYELLSEEFHTDGDLYQGSTLMRVIRRKADGKLFGFSFWQGGGKYGEAMVEPNGDDHGFPSKYDWEDGVEEDELWYVFLPVELVPLPAYKFVGAES
jgi:hypothetical protein